MLLGKLGIILALCRYITAWIPVSNYAYNHALYYNAFIAFVASRRPNLRPDPTLNILGSSPGFDIHD
jgi:hypothetical protein